ncbi:hypothetical protein C8J57DRAFT_1558903 [Mycena rebaudengoi]|nr:hypothetical protein C8J57DRAFT_1558903 [Mycena rebaudengoi]
MTLALLQSVHAWFRVGCTSPPQRLDPIVNPGQNPSNHVHTVHGAKNFAPNSTFDTLRASSCTSCLVTQDLPNYRFPKLYFQDPKTKLFEPVGNDGLLVYYQNCGDADVSNGGKAVPPGFKMLTGNPRFAENQGSQDELRERGVKWSCLRYTVGLPEYDDYGFPTTDCEAGLNARMHFPACWDGNVDSADHMAHTAYLDRIDNGRCPSTHPVALMKLFFEITWNVHDFSSRWNTNAGDKWPFIYCAQWHGDFQNGWETEALQNAIDQCNNKNDQTGNGVTEACRFLTVLQPDVADKCKTAAVVNEVIDGKLTRLPGCNPLQTGPGDATIYSAATCPI